MRAKIFVILFFLSCVARAEEGHWEVTKEGCQIYSEYITSVNSISWEGRCKKGKIDGAGLIAYAAGTKVVKFFAEYESGAWLYPNYAVTADFILKVNSAPTPVRFSPAVCKKLDDCNSLYGAAIKSGKLKKIDNSSQGEISEFQHSEGYHALVVLAGGTVECDCMPGTTPHYLIKYPNAPRAPSNVASAGHSVKSKLSIVNVCIGKGCELNFIHSENGDDPLNTIPEFYRRRNGSVAHVSYSVNSCSIGWTANVKSVTDNHDVGNALVCGAGSREQALTSAFEECSLKNNFDCRKAGFIQVAWAYWDGSYSPERDPEYTPDRKGDPGTIGGGENNSFGACGFYNNDLKSCEQYRILMTGIGVGH